MKIGVLGAGQLGQMLALAGIPLGLRFRFLDPSDSPCAAVAGEVVRGAYDDPAALDTFAAGLDVVTYEFENVPVATAEWLAERLTLAPSADALLRAQDRVREKQFFEAHGLPVAPFRAVDSLEELAAALEVIGLPAVLKTRRLGYDGKGQYVLRHTRDAEETFAALGGRGLILEAFVPFEREVSCIGVRARNGEQRFYPLTENEHEYGILRRSRPCPGDPLEAEAQSAVARLMTALDYVGVLSVEFFVHDGRLWLNEMAPRVHNSGHWTLDGAATSQFENHLRAICGWPLGDTGVLAPCEMFNLIGGVPPQEALLALGADLRVQLYGKSPAPGRKLGHLNLRGRVDTGLRQRLLALITAAANG